MYTTLSVDYENNAETFWDHVRTIPAESIPECLRPILIGDRDEIDLYGELSRQAVAWLRQCPGWNSGPSHARWPIVVNGSLDESDKDLILMAVEAGEPVGPSDVAGHAIEIARQDGVQAGLAEVRRAIAYDHGETRDGVGAWTE